MTPFFRVATRGDVVRMLEWAREEGWNPGIDDAQAFHASDPDGFFIAEFEGQPAAAISLVNHSPDFAFLGLYICRPKFRGQGLGFALWNQALSRASEQTIGFDGVPEQQENYRKSGFLPSGQTLRYSGEFEGAASSVVRMMNPAEIGALTALEARANGYAKPAFMAAWLCNTPTRYTLVLDRGEGATGFATLRACTDGTKIGPLVADNLDNAEKLMLAAARVAGPGPMIIDVPDDCPNFADLCAGYAMTVSFNTARMYRGTAPTPDRSLTRAIATLELG